MAHLNSTLRLIKIMMEYTTLLCAYSRLISVFLWFHEVRYGLSPECSERLTVTSLIKWLTHAGLRKFPGDFYTWKMTRFVHIFTTLTGLDSLLLLEFNLVMITICCEGWLGFSCHWVLLNKHTNFFSFWPERSDVHQGSPSVFLRGRADKDHT